jgi:hypothetical protein
MPIQKQVRKTFAFCIAHEEKGFFLSTIRLNRKDAIETFLEEIKGQKEGWIYFSKNGFFTQKLEIKRI